MFNQIKLSSKEDCPCGSQKSYGECCKMKSPKVFKSQGEFLNYMGRMMKKSRIKLCLAEGCESKGKSVIKAHALQENRILNKLSSENIVYMQNFSRDPQMIEVEKDKPEPFYFLEEVKIKDATVATCFCREHDDAIFSKIEKSQYTLKNLDDEQKFLFAYKTFSFEFYKELVAKKFHSNMFSGVPQLSKIPLYVKQYRNAVLKENDLLYYKSYYDEAFKNKDYGGLETVVIEFPFRIQFANYMTVAPPFDLKGKRIKSIDRRTKRMKYLFYTTFPVDEKSYLLVSGLKSDLDVYGDYFEQLRNAPTGLIQYYINVFIPLYSQNLIISPLLWNEWDEVGQMGVQYTVSDIKSTNVLLTGVKFHLQNISREANGALDVNTNKMPFNFFIPFEK